MHSRSANPWHLAPIEELRSTVGLKFIDGLRKTAQHWETAEMIANMRHRWSKKNGAVALGCVLLRPRSVFMIIGLILNVDGRPTLTRQLTVIFITWTRCRYLLQSASERIKTLRRTLSLSLSLYIYIYIYIYIYGHTVCQLEINTLKPSMVHLLIFTLTYCKHTELYALWSHVSQDYIL